MQRFRLSLFALCAAFVSASFTTAQAAWPERPVTIIVPFAAGGSTDVLARRIALELSNRLGQQFIIENRNGATGNIGGAMVARAEPDGYTLLFVTPGPVGINKFTTKNMPYDTDTAFSHIVLIAKAPVIVVGSPKFPVKDLKELVAYAKANPGKVTYGTAGTGTQGHLAIELLMRESGTQMTHVPYRGGANFVGDLISGRIDVGLSFVPTFIGPVQSGEVRGLGVTSAERMRELPDVPAASEAGFPGYEAITFFALSGPRGTPAEVVAKINGAVNDYLKTDASREQLRVLGMVGAGGTPAQLQATITAETTKWEPILKAANIGGE